MRRFSILAVAAGLALAMGSSGVSEGVIAAPSAGGNMIIIY